MISSASPHAACPRGVGPALKSGLHRSSSLPAPQHGCRHRRRAALRAAAGASSGGRGGSGSRAAAGGSGAPIDLPILKAAAADPIAFWGGVFAGALGLDLRQDPLKAWIEQTAAEGGLRYQATVQRLEQERQARASYDPSD